MAVRDHTANSAHCNCDRHDGIHRSTTAPIRAGSVNRCIRNFIIFIFPDESRIADCANRRLAQFSAMSYEIYFLLLTYSSETITVQLSIVMMVEIMQSEHHAAFAYPVSFPCYQSVGGAVSPSYCIDRKIISPNEKRFIRYSSVPHHGPADCFVAAGTGGMCRGAAR